MTNNSISLSSNYPTTQNLIFQENLRVDSESPFTFFENLEKIWKRHKDYGYDATFLDQVVDGCGYEIIKLNYSLMISII